MKAPGYGTMPIIAPIRAATFTCMTVNIVGTCTVMENGSNATTKQVAIARGQRGRGYTPAPLFALIHRSAWNMNSANFAFWGFSEVGLEY
jgi:hypothetical protein